MHAIALTVMIKSAWARCRTGTHRLLDVGRAGGVVKCH
jgi:hypothetical protein